MIEVCHQSSEPVLTRPFIAYSRATYCRHKEKTPDPRGSGAVRGRIVRRSIHRADADVDHAVTVVCLNGAALKPAPLGAIAAACVIIPAVGDSRRANQAQPNARRYRPMSVMVAAHRTVAPLLALIPANMTDCWTIYAAPVSNGAGREAALAMGHTVRHAHVGTGDALPAKAVLSAAVRIFMAVLRFCGRGREKHSGSKGERGNSRCTGNVKQILHGDPSFVP